MVCLNRETLRDKIYACWIGKNIGGTMGTPFEGKQQINDIQGFVTEPGVVLPNDDLDLQLVWLRAMDEIGPEQVNAKTLGEYWLTYIGPNWNEYGVGKSNLREGLLPPLSGEMNNEEWKHSNGAWIRTEIWACLYPGLPEKAIHYAFEDACVDHGYGEGTNAAVFVAAMESAAFMITDLRLLLQIGLSKIPENCRVAHSVQLVMQAYEKGIDWKTVREQIVQDSADLGWFQAPANIAFVVLGLLYGEGDFKKSMILAINCGDDTDCTGATVGSLLGIMNGSAGIPKDWSQHLGDNIVTMSVLKGHGAFPSTCTELTDCVMNLLPVTTKIPYFFSPPAERAKGVVLHDGPDDFGGCTAADFMGRSFIEEKMTRSVYSFCEENVFAQVWVAFDREPTIAPGGQLTGKLSAALKRMPEQKHFHLSWQLPEGWLVSGKKNLYANAEHSRFTEHASGEFTIVAGEKVEAVNRILLAVTCVGRATPLFVPITILG